MMDPMTMTALMGLVGKGGSSQQAAAFGTPAELFKLGLGISNAIKANKIAKNTQRPAYDIPNAMKESLGISEQMANDTRMTGQSLAEENIRGGTASGLRAIQETGGGMAEKLAAMSGLYSGEQAQMNQLGLQGAQQQNQDLRALQNSLGQMAGYQDKKWAWDKQQNFQETMDAVRRLRESANQNIYGGMKGLGAAGAMMMGGADKAKPTPLATPSQGVETIPTMTPQAPSVNIPMRGQELMADFPYYGGVDVPPPITPYAPSVEVPFVENIPSMTNPNISNAMLDQFRNQLTADELTELEKLMAAMGGGTIK